MSGGFISAELAEKGLVAQQGYPQVLRVVVGVAIPCLAYLAAPVAHRRDEPLGRLVDRAGGLADSVAWVVDEPGLDPLPAGPKLLDIAEQRSFVIGIAGPDGYCLAGRLRGGHCLAGHLRGGHYRVGYGRGGSCL